MDVQIFGVNNNADVRKAQRFFKERRANVHFMDLKQRSPSLGGGEAVFELVPMQWLEVEAFLEHWVQALPGPEPSMGGSQERLESERSRTTASDCSTIFALSSKLESSPRHL